MLASPKQPTIFDFGIYLLICICISIGTSTDVNSAEESSRQGKVILPIFQVIRFPNDPCAVSGGSKNGTCYTTEECSNKGGTNAGSCASGFGVCCTFTLNCGGSASENCTYFDSSTTVASGACKAKICRCSDNICQIRLDFSNFIISGPSTATTSIGKILGGDLVSVANGALVAEATQCLTDTFTITNQENLPVICGINSGYHVYFDASENCHDLNFQLGNVANGLTTVATRSWSIKVSQYSCDYENLAPSGCDQWHFGSDASNYIRTFNFQGGLGNGGRHLANQHQQICIRRETGMCRICYSVDARLTDIGITGKTGAPAAAASIAGTMCCGYGLDGAGGLLGGGDCIIIPGAEKTGATAVNESYCGSLMGLATAAAAAGANTDALSKTVCSKQYPFRVEFNSDLWEVTTGAADNMEAEGGNTGFKIRYFQTTC